MPGLLAHLVRRAPYLVGLGVALNGASASFTSASPAPRGTAIVTGGSRGIGAACCRQMAAKGWSVVVVYQSSSSGAAAVVDSIEASGGRALAVQADVSDEGQVVQLFETVDAWRGPSPLTALVNNAGALGPPGCKGAEGQSLGEATSGKLLDVMSVNVVGPLLCMREAEKRMSTARGGQGGAIVQVSSGSAYIGRPLLYASSKGALNSLTIGLVEPLARQGIRINTVSPGMTKTDMIADTLASFDMSQIPLGRVGTPDEIASTICWLCSADEASYVAGANVRVAGGRPPGTTLG